MAQVQARVTEVRQERAQLPAQPKEALIGLLGPKAKGVEKDPQAHQNHSSQLGEERQQPRPPDHESE